MLCNTIKRTYNIIQYNTIKYTIYNIQYTKYKIHKIQYTICNIQYTIHDIEYTIYNIQYTIHSTIIFYGLVLYCLINKTIIPI